MNMLVTIIADAIVIILVYMQIAKSNDNNISIFDITVGLYILYSIFTGIFILMHNNGFPVLYFYGLHMTIFPMLLYTSSRHSNIVITDIIDILLVVGLLHICVGILLYKPFLNYLPFSFANKLTDISEIIAVKIEDNWGLSVRMRSVLDSMSFGNIAAITTIISFHFLRKKHKFCNYLYLLLSVIAVTFSAQRSAWLGTFISIFFLIIFQDKNKLIRDVATLGGILSLILLVVALVLPSEVTNFVYTRFSDIFITGKMNFDAVSSRTDQWKLGIKYFVDYPWGYGIGTLGHKSVKYISKGIYDGNYFKILAETGIVGIGCFILMPLLNFIYFMKLYLRKKANSEITLLFSILVLFYFQAVGSNVWDLYYTNIVFWIVQGLFVRSILVCYNLNFIKNSG
jgi:hypothetical protein